MNPVHYLFIFLLIIVLLYCFVMIRIWYGWYSVPKGQELSETNPVKVSVIVAVRNEEEALPGLLNDLKNQSYDHDLFDILLIDDHSEKKTGSSEHIKYSNMKNLSVYELPEHKTGKKNALRFGAQKSKAELLIFTDADCTMGPDWISSYVSVYSNKKPGLILGLVDYHVKDSFPGSFFRFDLISLVICGAGASAIGRSVLCNGANLGVRRDLYLTVADRLKPDIPSGDDVFLLHEIKKIQNESISVLKSNCSVVSTKPPGHVREFLNQRIRWASKGKQYTDTDTLFLSAMVLSANSVMITVLFLCAFTMPETWYFLYIPLLKMLADLLILCAGISFFGKGKGVWFLPLYEIIYPFHVLVSAIGGIFNAYTWKSRNPRIIPSG